MKTTKTATSTTKNTTAAKTAKGVKKADTLTYSKGIGTGSVHVRVAKVATKKTAAPKPTKDAIVEASTKHRAPKLVTLKKMPKEDGDLPKQAVTILETIKAHKGSITTDKLFAALENKLETTQSVVRIYVFYRPRLLKGGYIGVKAA